MGAKNSTEKSLKNLDKLFNDNDSLKSLNLREDDCEECNLKKGKKEKKGKKDKKDEEKKELLTKPVTKGGCKQCALMNK